MVSSLVAANRLFCGALLRTPGAENALPLEPVTPVSHCVAVDEGLSTIRYSGE